MTRLTVRDVLGQPALRGARVAAGSAGLQRSVKGATVMEVPDISRWLRGGELVLTSLYALRGDAEAQARLISELVAVHAAGLLVKTRFVGGLPPEMLAEADRLALPLIEIPLETLYNDVLNGVLADLFARDALQRYASDLVEDLIRGRLPTMESVNARARQIGWAADGPALVAVLEMEEAAIRAEGATSLEDVQRRWDAIVDETMARIHSHHGLLGTAGRYVHLIFTGGDPATSPTVDGVQQLLESVLRRVASGNAPHIVSAGIGDPVESVLHAPESYTMAARALDIGRRLRGPGTIAHLSELGVYALLIDWLKHQSPTETPITNKGMQRLLAYDGEDGRGPLIETLRRYLDLQGNMRRTAAELFVHYKTVRYRMQRIRDITGWDLSRPELRLEVEIQLRLLELIDPQRRSEYPRAAKNSRVLPGSLGLKNSPAQSGPSECPRTPPEVAPRTRPGRT